MSDPREYTVDEVREHFLTHTLNMLKYWHDLSNKTTFERMDGLVFSILTLLDGGTELPGFLVAPCSSEDDKDYLKREGRNWYPENHESEVNGDIGGALHEYYSQMKKPEIPKQSELTFPQRVMDVMKKLDAVNMAVQMVYEDQSVPRETRLEYLEDIKDATKSLPEDFDLKIKTLSEG